MTRAQIQKINGNYFCKFHEFLPDNIVKDLIEDCDKRITDAKIKPIDITVCTSPLRKEGELIGYDQFPPEKSDGFLRDIENDTGMWKTVLERSRLAILQYCKLADIDHTRIGLHSLFAARLFKLPEHNPEKALARWNRYSAFNNLHRENGRNCPVGNVYSDTGSAPNNVVKLIIYLEIPGSQYGTMVQTDTKQLYFHEPNANSAFVFNPKLMHAAIYPTYEAIKDVGRRTIEIDVNLTDVEGYPD